MENLEPKEIRKLGSGDWELGTGKESAQSLIPITPYPQREPQVPQSRNEATLLIPSEDAATSKTQLILYLIPVIGFFPSLWTLYRRQGSREQLATSRLSITLTLAWLLGYLLLATGAATSDLFTLRLFILNSFLTSSYFLVSVWLIIRLIQGRSKRLPGFSNFAERMLGKYLS